MTNVRLGESYVQRARGRLGFLRQMQAAGLHADVVRESQEIVELALKGLARIAGLDVPKQHDIGKLLAKERDRLPPSVAAELAEIRKISKRLRRERELAFYGDEDFVPSEEYDEEDSRDAIEQAEKIVELVEAGVRELRERPPAGSAGRSTLDPDEEDGSGNDPA
jgi:HEPN domain-containing protein